MNGVKLSWEKWFGGLVAAVVQTIGTSGSVYLGGIVTGHHIDWEALAAGLVFAATLTFFSWISTHPLPITTVETTTITIPKPDGSTIEKETVVTKTETAADPAKPAPWDGKTERREIP